MKTEAFNVVAIVLLGIIVGIAVGVSIKLSTIIELIGGR